MPFSKLSTLSGVISIPSTLVFNPSFLASVIIFIISFFACSYPLWWFNLTWVYFLNNSDFLSKLNELNK